jgi:asparagine synthase (glutamine-hydrolysing)
MRSEAAYSFVPDRIERAILGGMLADITNFLTPLLRRLDRMSMAASVETRCPFLDQRIVHAVINLPLKYKLRRYTDKWVLKQIASAYIPAEIVNRKKKGFPLPVADYIAPLVDKSLFDRGFCTEVLGLQKPGLMAAVDDWRGNVHGFFNLLSLEIWGRLFFLGESVARVDARLQAIESARRVDASTVEARAR